MISPDSVLIIGAGLTGLSTAYHLESGHILEKEGEVGGLCRSYRAGGFTFDFTGHLLHLRDPSVRELVDALAPGRLREHVRRARIWSQGRLTSYPYQINLRGLPPAVITECLEGLREVEAARDAAPPAADFQQWIQRTFGRGIARHFMIPYNRKLWRVPLEELTTEWVAGLVPVPSYEDALRGAVDPDGVTAGYNARFLYPVEGGIALLPQAFLPHVPRIHLRREVVEVDLDRKRVVCRDGESYHWETLVSTMPLPLLVRACRPVPPEVATAAESLRYISVYDLNLGIAREESGGAHWIYFPEMRYPFYRVGFPGAFSPSLVPPGSSSVYVETAHLPEERRGAEEVTERALDGLRECGLLREDDRVVVRDLVHIPYAYVLFDHHRRERLPGLLAWLKERGVHSVGRYGAWEYTAMEDAILAGRTTAARIRQDHA